MTARFAARLAGTVLLSQLAGCVVTTYEGPGEPPRVPPAPELPQGAGSSRGAEGESFAEAPAKNEDKIAARHLLVQYKGS
ncbi:MAG TPA: hypothetical protein VGQ57_12905, partial [Polyangiaceae bacterium]|nr:hypothetical protein [Polyangiaceae bacterium]